MSLLPAGSKLGRFQIKSVLGQGAMGIVYLAHDPQIGRPVAIKTVRPESVGGESAQELEARFVKEARLAGRLQHPNIVTVYDVGREGDVCFIAMEYVDGRPLTRYLGGPDTLPLAVKVGMIRQVAEALGHAHERGVLHRDVKPGNILVGSDGRVKVTDFGIGKFTGASTSELTRAGHMVGSPAYMSPEQVKGEKLDGRSDLFSLGIVLYELLTGARPFPGESITTLVYQILHTEPKDPLEWKADLPVATREVIARLLAKSPDRRPADAHGFIQELARIEKIQRESEMTRRALAQVPPTRTAPTLPARGVPPPPPGPPPLPSPPKRRSGMPVILSALAVLVAASFFLLRDTRRGVAPIAAAPTPRVSAAAVSAPTAVPTAAPEPTAALEPSPVPTEAAAAPTAVPTAPKPRSTPRRRATATAAPGAAAAPASGEAPAAAAAAPSRPERVDGEYRTRRAVRFTSSPDQARLYLDGRYIGIADDWDNRGGGRELEFSKPGTHYVRMELPGYRTTVIEIEVSPESDRDSPSIDEEMDRRDRVAYERLPAPAGQTTGAVVFSVEPAGATLTEGGRELGPASAFGPGSPLQLKGPAVHDLMLAASGYRPKLIRILVAPNAGKDLAVIKETLKKD
ncbi:MAG TPA: serine/threonine-protein kinase [Thermoanaerobaculia bacterium]|jgi:serine/threonine protein kinase|nr:serine/threonine-protein kinase [Thermoanaerobaculia bacterium]